MELPLSPRKLLEATRILNAHLPPEDEIEEEDGDSNRWYCRFMAASDLHIGAPGFRAKEFMELLKWVRSNQLCIAGDFIDFMMLYWHRYFPQSHLTVIQKLLRRARKGLEIIYIPGNHDRRLRRLAAEALNDGDVFRLGENVVLVPLHVLVTSNGQRFLILHGDEFDGKSAFSQFWEKLGSHGYDVMMWLDRRVNSLLRLFGRRERQLSAWCKSWVKGLIKSYSQNFNQAVATVAEAYGVDGIIYGHVHTPSDEIINGVRVINLGAWVEAAPAGCTALVEDVEGNLALVQWRNGSLYHWASGMEIPKGEIRFAALVPAT